MKKIRRDKTIGIIIYTFMEISLPKQAKMSFFFFYKIVGRRAERWGGVGKGIVSK
jgi:hypothetical protein